MLLILILVNNMLKKKDLDRLKKKNKNNKVLNRIFNKTALVDLVTDYKDNLDIVFDIEVKTHGVVDQKSTGRCWSYAGLNILREQVIKKCNINNFELSGSYIAFYDKLERFNLYMEKLKRYHEQGKDVYDKDIRLILKTGFDDGSNYSEFKELIKKYGVMPKSKFSNSFQSNDTVELNEILSRLLRKYYLDLCNEKDVSNYLDYAYKVLGTVYGIPDEKFDFEYIDINNKYHINYNLTPKSFYDKYTGIDLDNYIEIYCYEDDKNKYNNMYYVEDSSLISGKKSNLVLNIKYDDLEKLIIKQLKNNEPVYFSSSTSSKYEKGLWIDLMDRYSDIFDIDLRLTNNEIVKTYGTSGEHSMVITGKSKDKWKIENSWGFNEGINGYFIAEDLFLRNYIISAVINKKYLNKEQKMILEKDPIKVNKWELKFI